MKNEKNLAMAITIAVLAILVIVSFWSVPDQRGAAVQPLGTATERRAGVQQDELVPIVRVERPPTAAAPGAAGPSDESLADQSSPDALYRTALQMLGAPELAVLASEK